MSRCDSLAMLPRPSTSAARSRAGTTTDCSGAVAAGCGSSRHCSGSAAGQPNFTASPATISKPRKATSVLLALSFIFCSLLLRGGQHPIGDGLAAFEDARAVLAPTVAPTVPDTSAKRLDGNKVEGADRVPPPVKITHHRNARQQARHKLCFVAGFHVHPLRDAMELGVLPCSRVVVVPLHALLRPELRGGNAALGP